MKWVIVAAVCWLIGAFVPWGRTGKSFGERLGDPMSLPIGFFAVCLAVPVLAVGFFGIGFVVETFS